MTIQARVEDANLLWNAGRLEGAFLNVLVAVAATARTCYPASTDREAFEKFVGAASRVKLSVEFRGAVHTIEHILYKWLRCELVHEASVPFDIEFMEDPPDGGLAVRAGGAPGYVLKLSHGWFHHLAAVVEKEDLA